jgi:hypothetical protein
VSAIDGLGAQLPIVSEAALPREVRQGSAEDRQAYRAALGFERLLVEQLTRTLASGAGVGGSGAAADDGTRGGDATAGTYGELLSNAMADGIVAAGGTGMAGALYRAMRPERS